MRVIFLVLATSLLSAPAIAKMDYDSIDAAPEERAEKMDYDSIDAAPED